MTQEVHNHDHRHPSQSDVEPPTPTRHLVWAEVLHEPVPRLPTPVYLLRFSQRLLPNREFRRHPGEDKPIELLRDELCRKRVKGTIGTGSMNDPYMPIEAKRQLTRRALEVIAEQRFPVHVLTKSDLVLRDLELLRRISQVYAAVSFTITTADDGLGKKLEPGASLVSERLRAMKAFAEEGLYTGVIMMPILPFLEDNEENITQIVKLAHKHGASYIVPAFGMTLRKGSRDYYYEKLDRLFPGLREKYEREFDLQYQCSANDAEKLDRHFQELCGEYGIATTITPFQPSQSKQLDLW